MSKKILNKGEKDFLINLTVTFVLAVIFLIGLVLRKCIFEWPIRWDFKTCVKEQWRPAMQKAVNFPEVD